MMIFKGSLSELSMGKTPRPTGAKLTSVMDVEDNQAMLCVNMSTVRGLGRMADARTAQLSLSYHGPLRDGYSSD